MKGRKQVSFSLNEEVVNNLKEYCEKNDYDFNILLEMIIRNYLPNKKKTKKKKP